MDKGYLLHLTHYDPVWYLNKKREKAFDMKVGVEIIDALAEEGFNMLFIGVSDGVRYKSHPELAKKYSIPMKDLKRLAAHARKCGLEIVPKLNFSKSEVNRHDEWSRAPGATWWADIDDLDGYLKKGFDCIDEIIDACEPKRFFHVGMDEDHSRSYSQYAETINLLHAGLRKRSIRTMIWNDSAISYPNGQIYVEKIASAYDRIPKDIVHIIWDYRSVPEKQIKIATSKGFDVWGAPSSKNVAQTKGFIEVLDKANGKGVLMTTWMKCEQKNRRKLLTLIKSFAK